MFALLERKRLWRAWFMLMVLRASVSLCGAGELRLKLSCSGGRTRSSRPASAYHRTAPLIATKLRNMPFKWKHFYEVNSRDLHSLAASHEARSVKRALFAGDQKSRASRIEARLYGRKKLVNTIKQALSDGELAVIGGDDKGENAWLVILRIVDPK